LKPISAPFEREPHALVSYGGVFAALLTWALWLALAIGYFGTFSWPLDLFANFRVQYMALFALSVILLTIARRRKTAIIALLGTALTTASMASYFPEQRAPQLSAGPFRVLTFNVWFRNEELARVARYLETSDADVVILHEVDLQLIEQYADLMPSYPYRTMSPNVRRVSAIFSRWPIRDVEHLQIPNRITRITRVALDWRGTRVAVVGAHLRWPFGTKAWARTAELALIAKTAHRVAEPLIVAGDFNMTPWSRYFDRFTAESGLSDCTLGHGLLATWPAQFLPARIRIDQCFASTHWRVRGASVGPDLGSDHLPLIADLELTPAAAREDASLTPRERGVE